MDPVLSARLAVVSSLRAQLQTVAVSRRRPLHRRRPLRRRRPRRLNPSTKTLTPTITMGRMTSNLPRLILLFRAISFTNITKTPLVAVLFRMFWDKLPVRVIQGARPTLIASVFPKTIVRIYGYRCTMIHNATHLYNPCA